MVKKSVRAGPAAEKKKDSLLKKNSETHPPSKQKQPLTNAGDEAPLNGFQVFKTLAENAPDVIFRVDRNLRFIFVNRKVSEFTGIPSEQFFGKTLLGLGLPKDFSIFWGKKAKEVFDAKDLREFEFTFDGPEGARWFHARIVPEFDVHGKVETVLGIAHEITDLKRTELAYRDERAFRDSIMRSLRIGITAVDPEGRQSYVNPSFCRMVGWSEEELEGTKLPFVYWPPEETENINRAFQQVLNGESPTGNMELRFRRRNGERFDALVLFSQLKDSQGNVIGWTGSVGDITEQKKKDEEIQKLNFELEQRIIERTAELDAAKKRLQESERKARLQLAELETIYDSAPVGLCVFDPNLTYLRINKQMAENYGVPAEDHIGRTPWEIVPEIANQTEALLRQVLETCQPIRNVEVSGETPAQPGVLRTWLEHWLPLKNEAGEVIAINIVAQEITERKRIEEALRAQEGTLRAFFNTGNLHRSILELKENDIVYKLPNQKTAAFFGLTVEEMVGKSLRDLGVPEEGIRFWLEQFRQCQKTRETARFEYVFPYKGKKPWFECSFSPIQISKEKPSLFSFVAMETTDRKRAEKEIETLNEGLRRRTAELENANKELETFSYSVSHDLKAPLIVASGFCRRLSERYGEMLDARGNRYLERIQEACRGMNLLIEDLLNLSKVTTGKIKFKSIDLSDLVKSIATQLKETQPERKVSFVIEEGLTAKGDSRLLKAVIENLLANAWKFTAKSKRAKIEFGLLKPIGEEPIYFVRDNGCGFDMSMAGDLFKPFQRLHTDEEFPGTGVGLASVRRIITRHGGRIWAESAAGKGATFFFTLSAQ